MPSHTLSTNNNISNQLPVTTMDRFQPATHQRKMAKPSPHPHADAEMKRVTALLNDKKKQHDDKVKQHEAMTGVTPPKNTKCTYLAKDKEDAITLMALLGVRSTHYKQLHSEKRLFANRHSAYVPLTSTSLSLPLTFPLSKMSRAAKQAKFEELEEENAQLHDLVEDRDMQILDLMQQLDQYRQTAEGVAIHQLQLQNARLQQFVAELQEQNIHLNLVRSITPSTDSVRTPSMSIDTPRLEVMPFGELTLPHREQTPFQDHAPLRGHTPFKDHDPLQDNTSYPGYAPAQDNRPIAGYFPHQGHHVNESHTEGMFDTGEPMSYVLASIREEEPSAAFSDSDFMDWNPPAPN